MHLREQYKIIKKAVHDHFNTAHMQILIKIKHLQCIKHKAECNYFYVLFCFESMFATNLASTSYVATC